MIQFGLNLIRLVDTIATTNTVTLQTGSVVRSAHIQKELHLRAVLREMGSVVVAFSGGVDSTYLAMIATSELGQEHANCITGDSASLSEHQRRQVNELVQQFGFRHQMLATSELEDQRYRANNPDRCYFCKSELFGKLVPMARSIGVAVVVDGSTTDDLGDHRPGRAAAAELGVRSPLIEAQMNKQDVRALSQMAGLPTWDLPASPCLASRVAYGTPVTIARLAEVDRGEEILRTLGFREFRVRHHDDLVRIEIAPQELDRALDRELVDQLAASFRALGFRYVTLDLHGFRSGAMNEVLGNGGLTW